MTIYDIVVMYSGLTIYDVVTLQCVLTLYGVEWINDLCIGVINGCHDFTSARIVRISR